MEENAIIIKLVNQYRSYIKKASRKYSIRDHFRLSQEDLECEGLLLLVEMVDYAEEEQFDRIFAKALKRKYISLVREFLRQKRSATLIDITEAYNLADKGKLEEHFIEKKVEHILQLALKELSEKKKRIIQEYIEPSNETIEYAIEDFMRKRHLFYAGDKEEHPTFYVGKEHIAKTLKTSTTSISNALRGILWALEQEGELAWRST